MKESYGEDLASYTDPESCAVARKDGREALTGTSYQRYPTALSLACKSLSRTLGAGHVRPCEREDHHRLTRFYPITTLL